MRGEKGGKGSGRRRVERLSSDGGESEGVEKL